MPCFHETVVPVAKATSDFWPPDNCWMRKPSLDFELNDTYA